VTEVTHTQNGAPNPKYIESLKAIPLASMKKSVCSIDSWLYIITCYIDLHSALVDSWKHIR
jgi:hypothetical protein